MAVGRATLSNYILCSKGFSHVRPLNVWVLVSVTLLEARAINSVLKPVLMVLPLSNLFITFLPLSDSFLPLVHFDCPDKSIAICSYSIEILINYVLIVYCLTHAMDKF